VSDNGKSTETYGDLLRTMRTIRGFGSREMAKKLNMNEGKYSRLESGVLVPPSTKWKVDKQIKPFELTEWQSQMFYDRAIADRKKNENEKYIQKCNDIEKRFYHECEIPKVIGLVNI
jgi:transcriptional regulator with XRE-family HTH domain